jgi:predicted nucleotidyltransferase component of viral defense system
MNESTIYFKQAELLVKTIPFIATETCFALKGGTAINLFVRDAPRLSVDIDLVYLPMEDRQTALKHIREALSRISQLIRENLGLKVQDAQDQSNALRLIVQQGEVRVKIELSPVIRGTVFQEQVMSVSPIVEENFGYAEIQVVSLPDLYAGKICAALDRQHPRDLFDVKFLLENEGFPEDFRKTFLVYLISHQRPMSELLNPHRKDLTEVYENEFLQMARQEVSLKELEAVRETLINSINTTITEEEKRFLLSFKSKTPEWALLGMEQTSLIAELPSVRWKLLNLGQMSPSKHRQAFERLQIILGV